MRLLFLITRADVIGGAQIHVRDLALRLRHDGHEVFLATGVAGPLTELLAEAGIACGVIPGMLREIDPLRDGQATRALVQTIRRLKPDLVATHSSKAGILGRIAARITGVPATFTAHGWAFTGGVPEPRRTLYRQIERIVAPLATRIICVSAHDGVLAERAEIGRGRVRVIHNGMPDVAPALLASPGAGPPRAVMVARFDRQKDHATLLSAVACVPDLGLDLIGDGPGRAEAERLAATLGLGGRVSFLGVRSDVAERLAQAHIFVLSSRWEGFPNSTLEAMRAGLPVVVSDVGGAAEAVAEGETGHVVPRGDVASLAGRLAHLAGDAGARSTMGEAGRRRFEDRFTFETMYRSTVAVYEECLRVPATVQSRERRASRSPGSRPDLA